MKRQVIIAFLVILCCWGPMDLVAQSMSQLDQQFISDELNQDELEAFENRAMQKLEDFYNLRVIIRGTTIDTILIEQAKELALKLFSSDNCKIYAYENQISILEYLEGQNETEKINPGVLKVEVLEPLSLVDKGAFAGSLRFNLMSPEETAKGVVTKTALISLKKVPKSFGNESQDIWQVFLCDIK